MDHDIASVTFNVGMTVDEFEVMDTFDYPDIMAWFPKHLDVLELNWDGHFGPRLIVTCGIEDVVKIADTMEAVRLIVEAETAKARGLNG